MILCADLILLIFLYFSNYFIDLSYNSLPMLVIHILLFLRHLFLHERSPILFFMLKRLFRDPDISRFNNLSEFFFLNINYFLTLLLISLKLSSHQYLRMQSWVLWWDTYLSKCCLPAAQVILINKVIKAHSCFFFTSIFTMMYCVKTLSNHDHHDHHHFYLYFNAF